MTLRRSTFSVLIVCIAASTLPSSRAETQTGHHRMLRVLQEVAARIPEEHFYLGDGQARLWRQRMASLSADSPDIIRWEHFMRLGEAEQRVGREQEAIDNFEKARELLPAVKADVEESWVGRLYFWLGIAYLRRGETRNCHAFNSPESCLLPIRGGGIHVEQEFSRRAIDEFTKLLALAPRGSEPYMSALWLSNIAYMTLGVYPQEVPARYLIPPASYESDETFPPFPNVARRAGVDTFSLSGGAIAEDFNQDGAVDLLVSSYDPFEQLRLFLNRGDGYFVDRTETAGLVGLVGGLNMVQGDYDNDGDVDVLVLRGAWLGRGGRHPNSLLRNNGDGTFTDVTFETGLGEEHFPTQTASWADFDNDGDLDLFVGNETAEGLEAPCQLFLNDAGSFRDIAASAGVTNDRWSKGVVWGDFDADRLPDLYVSNLEGANRLYRNLGESRFEDVAPRLGVTGPERSFPVWFWDFDNDGVLDLYVSAYEALIKDLALDYLGGGYRGEHPRLYKGLPGGGFRDVALEMGLTRPNAPMGANFGDLDNDGFLDFYLGTGYPPYFALMPNVMYRNREGRGFSDVTTAGGFGHLQKGHAVVIADLDLDGDQDVFEQMGGALAGDKYYDVLYENPGFGSHWLTVELMGVESNRSAIGARLRLDVLQDGQVRSIYKHVNSGGTFGGNPLRQTVGLGQAESIVALEIFWPTSNVRQSFRNVPLDRSIQVVESADHYVEIALPAP